MRLVYKTIGLQRYDARYYLNRHYYSEGQPKPLNSPSHTRYYLNRHYSEAAPTHSSLDHSLESHLALSVSCPLFLLGQSF
jgi:hypothetical protein